MSHIFKDNRGSIAIIGAISATLLIGATALVVDGGRVMSERAKAQVATDAAALAGASIEGDNADRVATAERYFTASFHSQAGRNEPPEVQLSGDRVSVSTVVTVPTTFGGVLGISQVRAPAFSEAKMEQRAVPVCLLALTESGTGIDLRGSARLEAKSCWAWSNSTSAASISGTGSASGAADGFCAVGETAGPNRFAPSPKSRCKTVADPFSDLPKPQVAPCIANGRKLGPGTHTLVPGTYCGGLEVGSSARVVFSPGTYVLLNGPLELQGQSFSEGTGVTFYFTGDQGKAGLHVQGSAAADFKAPTSGDMAGILFYQDGTSRPGARSLLTGGARVKLEGVLYMPTWELEIVGNGMLLDEAITVALIADRFSIHGTGDIIVRADPQATGLFATLPRGGVSGARLVR
jgi:hypothetical protein